MSFSHARNIVLLFGALELFVAANARGDDAPDNDALPASWYRLPELGGSEGSEIDEPEREKKVFARIDRLIRANSAILERYEPESPAQGKFRLAGFSVGLGLSAQGLLGVMVVRGDVSAGLSWRRRTLPPSTPRTPDGDDAIAASDTTEGIAIKLEPIIRAALATGRI